MLAQKNKLHKSWVPYVYLKEKIHRTRLGKALTG